MYQVLYRKYRPQVFADVVGQPQVTKVLAEQVASDRLAHAYLFTGSRGTGKTTCARIFAKAVCCRNPAHGDPCGHCEICTGIDNGSVLDYSEMDAASNRSIEDIRRIREEAWIAPAAARKRIFVLDEVHMLTNEAFNALLKILEEPPEHVIFILATTDVQKLPGTILSRCQRFDFMRIDPKLIAARLQQVAALEGRTLTEDAAAMIAGMADGAMRDSLSILDRCMSEPGDITADVVAAAVGLVGKDSLFRLADAVAAGDASLAVRLVNDFHRASCDGERLCADLLGHFRNYMIVKSVKKPENIIVCTAADLERYRRSAEALPLEKILYYIDILSDAAEKLKKSTNGIVDAEMAVLRLCMPQLADGEAALKGRIAALEQEVRALKAGGFVPAAQTLRQETPAHAEPSAAQGSPPAAPFAADDPPPFSVADADVTDDAPMAMPFDLPETDDAPMAMPFDLPETDDAPMAMPFDMPDEDDAPMAMPFDMSEADDAPMAMPFDMPDEDDAPMAMPFDMPDEDDAPMVMPFDAPETDNPPPASVKKINPGGTPFARWSEICAEIKRISPAFTGLIDGSSAVENGNYLVLSSLNPVFKTIVAPSEHMVRVIAQAAQKVTGKAYSIKFV
ncbi:MAG: DNA polymerase III subunit gamma/tau [Clostridia bacterium]|nr:DNA polymerase III subunit gamma/tau [Clostridia bacterium]